MSDFYSKGPNSPVTVSLSSLNGATLSGAPYSEPEAYSATLAFATDGTWQFDGYATGLVDGSWATPTTAGIGSGYWVRWTRTFFSGGSGNSASASSGWQQLSSARTITVSTGGTAICQADYTLEIATDSSGTNVVATASTSIVAQITPA